MPQHAKELRTDEEMFALLASAKRIAVLGIKTETHAGQPAFYVPKYMQDSGYDIIPVPVYYPEVTEILGEKVYRRVAEVPGAQRREPTSQWGVEEPHVGAPPPIDIVNVFRKSSDVAAHVDDILLARPRAVWLQQGIRDDAVADVLVRAGIQVVQDACILVMHRRYLASLQVAPATRGTEE